MNKIICCSSPIHSEIRARACSGVYNPLSVPKIADVLELKKKWPVFLPAEEKSAGKEISQKSKLPLCRWQRPKSVPSWLVCVQEITVQPCHCLPNSDSEQVVFLTCTPSLYSLQVIYCMSAACKEGKMVNSCRLKTFLSLDPWSVQFTPHSANERVLFL